MEILIITFAIFVLIPIYRFIEDHYSGHIKKFFRIKDVLNPLSPKLVRLRMERNLRSDSMRLQNYLLTAKTVAELIDLELDIHYFKTAYENIVSDRLLEIHTKALEESYRMRMAYLHERKVLPLRVRFLV